MNLIILLCISERTSHFSIFLCLFSSKVQAARDEMQWGEEGPPPLLVKIAPDLSKDDLEDIAAVCIKLLLASR